MSPRIIKKIFQFNKKTEIYWRVVLPVIALCLISLILLKSTGQNTAFYQSSLFKQSVWIVLGILIIWFLQYLRIQFFYEYGYHLYLLLIILLIITFFMPSISGAKRWIVLGSINFQPSEAGKLIVIFAISKYLSDQHDMSHVAKIMSITIGIAILPAILVFKQPDLGTAIIYLAITIPMLYWVGFRPFHLFIVVAPVISILAASDLLVFYIWIIFMLAVLFLSRPKIWQGVIIIILNITFGSLTSFIWNHLYDHQKQRVLTFLDPARDPQGTGYQILQSITAVGSGGFTGKGFGSGTQTHLRFLPVRDTDFILSVAGEEFGLIGIIVIIILFCILFYWMTTYAQKITNKFASLSIIGFTSLLFVHIFINMAMTIGIFPVTGLP
ncbi:MAG: rod shape-determining protein RodA, partial [Fidelibacterota bacterium]